MPPTAKTAVFLQNACLEHRFIRHKDTSLIVERPERLRAITVGLAGALARLEFLSTSQTIPPAQAAADTVADPSNSNGDDLVAALDRLKLSTPTNQVHASSNAYVSVRTGAATPVNLLTHPGVQFIHGTRNDSSVITIDTKDEDYPQNLTRWAKESQERIDNGESEIPEGKGLSQGDLYLCPTSIDAIQAAVGTVCDAVDTVINASRANDQVIPPSITDANAPAGITRAFLSVRPPGHHCGEDTPSGFCFVNNIAVGAAHSHLKHDINRVVILDIDLHHGNGTQSIVWQINEETYRQTLELEGGAPPTAVGKLGPKIYYGSLHDILSYPCEDGKAELIQAASTSIHGAHGQFVENVHLETYTSESHFWDVLYQQRYRKLLDTAEEFVKSTSDPDKPDDLMVFISTGFDASEHETPGMSRHGRRVPTSFYHRFTADVCAFADKYAKGRVVSVLEGGYGDRALLSGAMAHLSGLSGAGENVDESWWSIDNLIKLEKATSPKRHGGRPSLPKGPQVTNEPWLDRALAIFSSLEEGVQYSTPKRRGAPGTTPSSMTLRERKPRNVNGAAEKITPSPSPMKESAKSKITSPVKNNGNALMRKTGLGSPADDGDSSSDLTSDETNSHERNVVEVKKKLPRVILKLGPDPNLIPPVIVEP